MKQQADQHQATLQEHWKYILNLEQLMHAEVKSHQQANDALQQTIGEKTALTDEVRELSSRLESALEQIQKLTEDLTTTRSLLDVQNTDRQAANAGASTSAPIIAKSRIPAQAKGKKTPSRSDTPIASARSRQAAPSKYGDLWKRKLVGGNNDGETSSGDSEDNDWVPLGHPIQKQKCGQEDCEDS